MTVVGLLVAILFIVVVGLLAHWIIGKFLPDTVKVIAYAIVGILLLIMLFALAMPDVGNYKLWTR